MESSFNLEISTQREYLGNFYEHIQSEYPTLVPEFEFFFICHDYKMLPSSHRVSAEVSIYEFFISQQAGHHINILNETRAKIEKNLGNGKSNIFNEALGYCDLTLLKIWNICNFNGQRSQKKGKDSKPNYPKYLAAPIINFFKDKSKAFGTFQFNLNYQPLHEFAINAATNDYVSIWINLLSQDPDALLINKLFTSLLLDRLGLVFSLVDESIKVENENSLLEPSKIWRLDDGGFTRELLLAFVMVNSKNMLSSLKKRIEWFYIESAVSPLDKDTMFIFVGALLDDILCPKDRSFIRRVGLVLWLVHDNLRQFYNENPMENSKNENWILRQGVLNVMFQFVLRCLEFPSYLDLKITNGGNAMANIRNIRSMFMNYTTSCFESNKAISKLTKLLGELPQLPKLEDFYLSLVVKTEKEILDGYEKEIIGEYKGYSNTICTWQEAEGIILNWPGMSHKKYLTFLGQHLLAQMSLIDKKLVTTDLQSFLQSQPNLEDVRVDYKRFEFPGEIVKAKKIATTLKQVPIKTINTESFYFEVSTQQEYLSLFYDRLLQDYFSLVPEFEFFFICYDYKLQPASHRVGTEGLIYEYFISSSAMKPINIPPELRSKIDASLGFGYSNVFDEALAICDSSLLECWNQWDCTLQGGKVKVNYPKYMVTPISNFYREKIKMLNTFEQFNVDLMHLNDYAITSGPKEFLSVWIHLLSKDADILLIKSLLSPLVVDRPEIFCFLVDESIKIEKEKALLRDKTWRLEDGFTKELLLGFIMAYSKSITTGLKKKIEAFYDSNTKSPMSLERLLDFVSSLLDELICPKDKVFLGRVNFVLWLLHDQVKRFYKNLNKEQVGDSKPVDYALRHGVLNLLFQFILRCLEFPSYLDVKITNGRNSVSHIKLVRALFMNYSTASYKSDNSESFLKLSESFSNWTAVQKLSDLYLSLVRKSEDEMAAEYKQAIVAEYKKHYNMVTKYSEATSLIFNSPSSNYDECLMYFGQQLVTQSKAIDKNLLTQDLQLFLQDALPVDKIRPGFKPPKFANVELKSPRSKFTIRDSKKSNSEKRTASIPSEPKVSLFELLSTKADSSNEKDDSSGLGSTQPALKLATAFTSTSPPTSSLTAPPTTLTDSAEKEDSSSISGTTTSSSQISAVLSPPNLNAQLNVTQPTAFVKAVPSTPKEIKASFLSSPKSDYRIEKSESSGVNTNEREKRTPQFQITLPQPALTVNVDILTPTSPKPFAFPTLPSLPPVVPSSGDVPKQDSNAKKKLVSLEEWNVADVHQFFERDSVLSKFSQLILDEDIDGRALITLTDQDMGELGFSFGAKRIIKTFIENNKKSAGQLPLPSPKNTLSAELMPVGRSCILNPNDNQELLGGSTLPPDWLQQVPRLSVKESLYSFVGVTCPPNRPDLESAALNTTREYINHKLDVVDELLLKSSTCPSDISHDVLTSIAIFTLESSLYKLLNAWTNRSKRTVEDLKFVSPYLRHLTESLRALPARLSYQGFGVRIVDASKDILLINAYNNYKEHFSIGKEVNFHSVCSFSKDETKVKNFYSSGGPVIVLQCQNVKGYFIDEISMNPRLPGGECEAEIIVEGPSFFKVKSDPLLIGTYVLVHIEYDEKKSKLLSYLSQYA